jgi:hypothetical protein
MEPDRLLAALLGEFGRSLVAVSKLIEESAIITVTPAQLESFAVDRHQAAMTPLVGAPDKVARRRQKPMVLPKDEASRAPMRRAILISLAQFGRGMTPSQIGLYSGKAHKGGAFVSAFSDLKADECVEGFGAGSTYRITPKGLEELGDWARLPEGMALFEHWCSKLGPMAEAILRILLQHDVLTPEQIGELTGKAHKGGAFVSALSSLKRMQLVVCPERGTVELAPDLRRAVAPSVRVFDKGSNTHHRIDAHKGHVR